MSSQKACEECGTKTSNLQAKFCSNGNCAQPFPALEDEPPGQKRGPRLKSDTKTIAISSSDEDGCEDRPGRSSGSILTAKGAVKVREARKLAGKRDVMKHTNKSKYS